MTFRLETGKPILECILKKLFVDYFLIKSRLHLAFTMVSHSKTTSEITLK